MNKKEMIGALRKRLEQVEADNLVLLTRVAKLETKFDNHDHGEG